MEDDDGAAVGGGEELAVVPEDAGPAEADGGRTDGRTEDDDEGRGHWASDLEFILACMGCAIGVGNTFRFPWFLYKYGSGFLFAYWMLFFLMAYPTFVFELVMGQFSSLGPVHIWRHFIPALEGIGWGTIYVQACLAVYHSAVFAVAIFYTGSSFTAPWASCTDAPWNTPFCFAASSYLDCVGKGAEASPNRHWYVKKRCYKEDNITQLFSHIGDCIDASAMKPWDHKSPPQLATPYGTPFYIPGHHDCSFVLKFRFDKRFGPKELFRLRHVPKTDVYNYFGCDVSQTAPDFQNIASIFMASRGCGKEMPWEATEAAPENRDWAVKMAELDSATGPDDKCEEVTVRLERRHRSRDMLIFHKTASCFRRLIEEGRAQMENPEWNFEWLMHYYCARHFPSDTLTTCARAAINPDESYSSEEYLTYHMAQAPPDHFTEAVKVGDRFSWKLLLSLALVWVLTGLGTWQGVKLVGKIAYLTAVFPFVMVVILVVVASVLPGFSKGVSFYIAPNFCTLADSKLWSDALGQIFATNSLGTGGVISLASYNHFNNDFIRDSLLITISNGLFSFISGFGTFGVLGYMAFMVNSPVADLLNDPQSVTFVAFSQASSTLPGGQALAFFFYLMLVFLAIDSQFAMAETLLTFIYDEVPKTRKYKWAVVLCVCSLGFLLAIPFASAMGFILLGFIDSPVYKFCTPVLVLLSIVATTAIYGVRNFTEDIRLMVGATRGEFDGMHAANFVFNTPARLFNFVPKATVAHPSCSSYYLISWVLSVPVGMIVILVFGFITFVSTMNHNIITEGGLTSEEYLFIVIGLGVVGVGVVEAVCAVEATWARW